MYTTEDGKLYLFLPEKEGTGARTITVTINGTTYSGSVTTSAENQDVVTTLVNN